MVTNYDNITITEATAIQDELRSRLQIRKRKFEIKTIAGGDISFNRFSPIIYAGIVLMSFPGLKLLAYSLVRSEIHFPYVPGYLAFREVPPLTSAYEQMPTKPDLLIIDGHGIAHPRRMGIAAHFGVLTAQATMGCAKKLLFGKYEEPPLEQGNCTPVYDGKEQIGWALRSRTNTKPIFVSPGNFINVDDSLEVIKQCLGKYRIPVTTRLAHDTVNKFRRGELEEGYTPLLYKE